MRASFYFGEFKGRQTFISAHLMGDLFDIVSFEVSFFQPKAFQIGIYILSFCLPYVRIIVVGITIGRLCYLHSPSVRMTRSEKKI